MHEVLYVGQAYGKSGERTAWDRLRRHETVQRILSENPLDQQVWLTLAAISDANMTSEIDPTVSAEMTDEQDNAHIDSVARAATDGTFEGRVGVALAEAGLISFFKPHYNQVFKDRFPDPEHVSLSSARDLDLYGLVVEMQGYTVNARYWSVSQQPAQIHFAGFRVHNEVDRSVSFTDAPPPMR